MSKILLVEDNPRFVIAGNQYIVRSGHTATIATEYSAAYYMLSAEKFDGVITDCFFPEIAGSKRTDLGMNLVEKMAQSDPRESRIRNGLRAFGQYVDLEDPEALKYARFYLGSQTGDISESPVFKALRQVASISRETVTHTFKQTFEVMYREERAPKDYYGALAKAIGESEANQPLGLLVAEKATELCTPVILATSTFHHDILTQPVQDYASRNGWILVDCNFGREDEKASPEFWKRALDHLERKMNASGD